MKLTRESQFWTHILLRRVVKSCRLFVYSDFKICFALRGPTHLFSSCRKNMLGARGGNAEGQWQDDDKSKGASINDVRSRGGRRVTEKQTKAGRLCEFYTINQLPNMDKGERVKKSKIFEDVMYGRPPRRRHLHSLPSLLHQHGNGMCHNWRVFLLLHQQTDMAGRKDGRPKRISSAS